ncbi:MAG: hypothetical protein ACR2PG_09430 [Hyphomicrobiaceae bacterium]
MGHEDLLNYGDATRPVTTQEAVSACLWLVADEPNVPTGGFYTGLERVAWQRKEFQNEP